MLLSPPSPETDTPASSIPRPAGTIRWMVCTLLLIATVINYVDRTSLSFLAPRLEGQFHWSNQQFGAVIAAFQITYTAFNPIWGGLMDRFGIRRGYTAAVVWWSLASMGHALARSVVDFGIWRALLGIGEAGSFPGGIKTLAEWFPQRERGTANGLFNAGANLGGMVAPIVIIAALMTPWGWRGAFAITGVLGFIWAAIWWVFYRPAGEHPWLTPNERAWISQGGPPRETLPKVPWRQLIGERRAWAFILGKAFSDPVWSFFVFWDPKFFSQVVHLNEWWTGAAVVIVFLMADVGSVFGGWLSGHLIGRGWSVNRARKTTMAIAAFTVPFVVIAAFTHNKLLAVGLVGLALAMHQWWSSNLFTLTSDMFPTEAVGTVVGMGQVGGSLMGIAVPLVVGWVLDTFHAYQPLFIAAMFFYPTALLLVHLCAPKLDRVTLTYT